MAPRSFRLSPISCPWHHAFWRFSATEPSRLPARSSTRSTPFMKLQKGMMRVQQQRQVRNLGVSIVGQGAPLPMPLGNQISRPIMQILKSPMEPASRRSKSLGSAKSGATIRTVSPRSQSARPWPRNCLRGSTVPTQKSATTSSHPNLLDRESRHRVFRNGRSFPRQTSSDHPPLKIRSL